MATETASPARDDRARADGRTIARLWRDAAAAGRTTPAYLVEGPDGWREVSWDEAAQRVDDLANGLLALGIRKGDAVAILAQTRPEWALADLDRKRTRLNSSHLVISYAVFCLKTTTPAEKLLFPQPGANDASRSAGKRSA